MSDFFWIDENKKEDKIYYCYFIFFENLIVDIEITSEKKSNCIFEDVLYECEKFRSKYLDDLDNKCTKI